MTTYPWPKVPWPHQLKEFEEHRDDDNRALLWQMRTGKTRSALDVAFYRHAKGDIDGVLILAPNGVHYNWIRRQIPQHAWIGHKWIGMAWQATEAKKPHHQAILERVLTSNDDHLPFLAVNSESLIHDKAAAVIAKFLKKRRVMVIVDEAHDFRSPGSRRTKRARALVKRCTVRRILTGTSTSNGPLGAYSQFELLGKGTLGFGTFAEFEAEYATYERLKTKGGQSYDKLQGYKNLEDLQRRIAEHSSVVLRSEVDMSEIVFDTRDVLMTDHQQDSYRTLVRDLILEMESGEEVEALNGGAMMVKLQQIASGFVVDTAGAVHDVVPDDKNPRLLALVDEAQNCDGKMIVWCKYHEDIKRVVRTLRALGRNPVEYHGRIHSQAQRQAAVDGFQEDPAVTDFVGQPRAGGVGLELKSADLMIWYSHTFDLIEREQANERASAVGGKAMVVRDIVMPGTIDERILELLDSKRSVADMLTGTGLRDRLITMLRGML